VELKKVNSKHIFKSTITPQMQRKSVSVDSGIDRGVTGASPTATSGKLNRRDNVSITLLITMGIMRIIAYQSKEFVNII